MDFDYAAARAAGYSDDDILAGLAKKGRLNFDLEAARKAGHSATEIMNTLVGGQRQQEPAAEPESSGLLRRAGDIGLSAIKGAVAVPEALVGLADIVTGGAAGRAAKDLGFDFQAAKDVYSSYYTPEQKAANQRVAEAEGFVDTAGAMLANPSTIVQTGVESLPLMVAGGAVGRGVTALAPRIGAVGAGAIGEGVVGAGSQAEGIRQQTADGSLSLGQAGAAVASGIGTGVFGAVGGRLAQKLGIGDIDTMLAGGGAAQATGKGVARRLLEGGVSEGVFEELPQSIQEQIWQNAAMDKPLLDGVPQAAAQGLIAGGLFGGVAGVALRGAQGQPENGAPLALTNTPDPFLSFPDGSVGRRSEAEAFIAGLPEPERLAARARLFGYGEQDQPPATPEDVLAAPSIDEAIAVANRAIEQGTPEFRAQRDAEIDAAWALHLGERAAVRQAEFDAAQEARRAADVPLMQDQVADQQVEQAVALTRAQGFDEPAPTAIQLAMQEAQAKRAAMLAAAQQPQPQTQEVADESAGIAAGAGTGTPGLDAGIAASGTVGGVAADRGPAVGAGAPAGPAIPDAAAGVDAATAAAPGAAAARADGADAAVAGAAGRAAEQPVSANGPAPAEAVARAREILTAAGVTGNERMAALRSIRTGENTLDDLIDAHPPKENTDAPPPTAAPALPGRYPAGDPAPAPVQQAAAPGREAVPERADMGSGTADAAGLSSESAGGDGAGTAAAPAGELTTRVEPTNSLSRTASWVIRSKATGKVVMETFDRKKVDALNAEKYEAVPIQQHLAEINDPASKAGRLARGEVDDDAPRQSAAPAAPLEGMDKVAGITEEYVWQPDSTARASEAPASASGMSAADVTKAITRLRAKWMGFHRVNVVQSIDDLPADILERAAPDSGTEGLYDPRTKSVYLIADAIATPERAAWVAAHEVVGHGGLRMLQDKDVNAALNIAGTNRFVKDLAAAIGRDRGALAPNIQIEEAVAELAAAIETDNLQGLSDRYGIAVPAASQNGLRGVIARVIEAVKRFLSTVAGNPASGISDADVRALIGEQQAAVAGNQSTGVSEMVDAAPARASVIPASERTIEVAGARRPITDSTGKLVAQDFQKQQAFYRWFKDSAVVDEQGRPLVVYHGSRFGGFSVFMRGAGGYIYVTPNDQYASRFAGSSDGSAVYPVYVAVQNPLDLRQFGEESMTPDEFKKALADAGITLPDDVRPYSSGPAWKHVKADGVKWAIEDGGYDGLRIIEGDGIDAIAAFHPEQIKSATGNAGTFDPNSDSILQSRAAAAPPAPPGPAGEERIPKWAADLSPAHQAALRKSGAIYTEQTMRQKIDALKAGALQKLRYGILDQFAPIQEKLGRVPYVLARMAKNADGTLEALMLYGRPHLDADGGMLVDTTKKGFIETMQALNGEHDRFFSWLAGRRAEQLKKEGRENLFTDDDISALATLNQGRMKDGSSREAAYLRAQKDVAELNKSVLDIAQDSGLIDAESRKVWASDFYVPFYRVMEEGITGPSVKSGLVNQKSIKKLKGGTNNLGDLTQNMLMNWSTLLTASAKNRAAKASLDAAVDIGAATEAPEATIRAMAKSAAAKAVSYMEEGTNRWFVVEDEHLLGAIAALEFSGYNNQAMKAMTWFKNALTRAITASPYFKIRNLLRDSITVLAVSDANYNVLDNWKQGGSLLRDKDARAQMVASGGIYRFGTYMEGNRGENVKRLIDAGIDDGTVLNTAEKMAKFTRKLWGAYEEVGDFSENLNRAALYKKLRAEGKSHLEASFEARDLMDFGLSGAWAGVRALNQILPFFNARLQGLYKLGRGYNDDPKRMGYVVGAVALASVALMLAYKDDDDFKKRTDADRNNYWWFKVGGIAYRIPKPFEIGAMGSAIEHFTALFVDSENTNGERFAAQMRELINGQLAMNPIPQVFRPMIDVYANKDAFQGRPIETMAMQRLKPEDRYNANTSELARLLSKSGVFVDPVSLVAGTGAKQLSPVQIDSLIRGYFSGVGTLAVGAVDGLLHHTVIDRGAALPLTLKDFAGSFAETLPTNSSRYVNSLYEAAQDIEQSYASYQNALKQGDVAKALAIRESDGDKIAKYHLVESLKKNESRINAAIQRTRDSKELTGQQKEEAIRRLKVVQDQIARQFATR